MQFLISLFFLPAGLLGAFALPPSEEVVARALVSPDRTCGVQSIGGYFCPFDTPCCSGSGFCGSGDAYCLTSTGCQADYVAPGSKACYAPTDKVTITPDNTCGKTGANEFGYHCGSSLNCCSGYGYCGNTTAYCDQPEFGCQPDYGYCRRTGA
ncbi:hypothetical protein BKA67DRAFT_694988 [Truncatella angustata]|uniref:Chitin-binding type-1 domain-containing protein n=1 Tax=Truncatella angustata TaxID=152316 RepID=A0A9P8UDQ6_9PEZI|nr:uncharacterized protein BKA67DRAFT_694988 [Truncatella angustata]KAH6648041.1 hypothetical protein BKA67DRAFT_694988 [Truncatella angustata]